jgi:hypothetical protein
MNRRSQKQIFNTPIIQSELGKKRGFMFVNPTVQGHLLSYDFNKDLSGLLKGYSYYYVISIDCPCVDPLDDRGKVKLGYSAAQSTLTSGWTQRLSFWQRVYGSVNLRLHMLVLFKGGNHYLASQYESQVKQILHQKKYIENGANIDVKNGKTMIHKNSQKAEFFRIVDLRAVLDASLDVYNNPKNNKPPARRVQPRRN